MSGVHAKRSVYFCFVFKKLLFLSCECELFRLVALAWFDCATLDCCCKWTDMGVPFIGDMDSVCCSFRLIFNSNLEGRFRLARSGGMIRPLWPLPDMVTSPPVLFCVAAAQLCLETESSSVNWNIGSANILYWILCVLKNEQCITGLWCLFTCWNVINSKSVCFL